MLRPLNDRVLIKPHKNPDVSDGGLILPENRAEQYAEMQGTVVAVGTPKHPKADDAEIAARQIERNGGLDFQKHAKLLRDLVRREPCVQPGDDVLFSWTSGQEITIDDERYFLMREDDLLAKLETE